MNLSTAMVMTNTTFKQTVPFPIYFNFLHGIELGLKAYLLHVNAATINELKSKQLGHNLSNLLDKALEHDLHSNCPELTDSVIDVIRFSSNTYADKQYEYVRIGSVQLMPIDKVVEAADILIRGLKQLDMKSANEVGLTHTSTIDQWSRHSPQALCSEHSDQDPGVHGVPLLQ